MKIMLFYHIFRICRGSFQLTKWQEKFKHLIVNIELFAKNETGNSDKDSKNQDIGREFGIQSVPS